MAYWYDNKELENKEREYYRSYAEQFKSPFFKVQFSHDNQKRFTAEIEFLFRLTKEAMMEIAKELPHELSVKAIPIIQGMDDEQPWRRFKFLNVYAHDYPGREGVSALFGGSIKVFPMTNIKQDFHHLIYDQPTGLRYVCQVGSVKSSEVNGYNAMRRIARFLTVYIFWCHTGIDIDREGGGKWNKKK